MAKLWTGVGHQRPAPSKCPGGRGAGCLRLCEEQREEMRLDSGADSCCRRAAWPVTGHGPVLRGRVLTLCPLPGAEGPTLHLSGGGAGPEERGPRTGPGSPRRKCGKGRSWEPGTWNLLPGTCCPAGGRCLPRRLGRAHRRQTAASVLPSLRLAEVLTGLQAQSLLTGCLP